MKKQIIKMSMLAMMVMGGVNAAHAATSSTVTVSGAVNAVTCQLGLDKASLDLGAALPGDFVAPNSIIKEQKVTATLTNCGAGVTGASAGVQVSGSVISGASNNDIFGSDVNATWGFGVVKDGGAKTALIKNGAMLDAIANGTAGTALENSTYVAEIGLVAPVTTGSAVKASPAQTAPILFAFVNP